MVKSYYNKSYTVGSMYVTCGATIFVMASSDGDGRALFYVRASYVEDS